MRPLASIALTLALTTAVPAQDNRTRLYSNPSVPPRDVLERLNLKEAWSAVVPTTGRVDGILSVQLAPLFQDNQLSMHLLVQTRAGLVLALDAETGEVVWRSRVGKPFTGNFALGFSNQFVVAERAHDVYGLSRRTGEELWRTRMDTLASSAPLVSQEYFHIARGTGEVAYYTLPTSRDPNPIFYRSYRAPVVLELQPARTRNALIYPSPGGTVVALDPALPFPLQTFRAGGRLVAGPGVHEVDETVYIGSRDTNVYANPLDLGEPSWRFTTGGTIERPPFVTDEDVYAVSRGRGLFRLRRRTLDGKELAAHLATTGIVRRGPLDEVVRALGPRASSASSLLTGLQTKGYLSEQQRELVRWRGGENVWRAPDGYRVLAVNPKFVYAADGANRLVILERERGRLLSRYDTCDFVVPVSNELTDRIYLAANNGLVVCLRDREYATPVTMKQLVRPGAPPRRNGRPPQGGQ